MGSELYEWSVLPFDVTNVVPCFQRIANDFVRRNALQDHVVSYLSDRAICAVTEKEHDQYLNMALTASKTEGFGLNDAKCNYRQHEISLLCHVVGGASIKQDLEQLKSLLHLNPHANKNALQRLVGIFAYFAIWLVNFSDRMRPLIDCTTFPITRNAIDAFNELKTYLAKVPSHLINKNAPFAV